MAKPIVVQKRGGVRRAVKIKKNAFPTIDYKIKTKNSLFPKRLTQYRYLFCTDLNTDDMVALTMFTAWIKTNEKYFESRNDFPIYGFIISETKQPRIKAQRVREFLHQFGETLGWNEPDHHLYNGYMQAGTRIWLDESSNDVCEDEASLLNNQNILEDPDYPDPEMLITKIDELMQVKPNNLFVIYLKPLRLLRDHPEIVKYFRRVAGATYGPWDATLTPTMCDFFNRSTDDGQLLYCEPLRVFGKDNVITPNVCLQVFKKLEEVTDNKFIDAINSTMYVWNDNVINKSIQRLQELSAFKNTDFDDYQSFSTACDTLTTDQRDAYQEPLVALGSLLKNNSRQFVMTSPLVIMMWLIAGGIITDPNFKLENVAAKGTFVLRSNSDDAQKATKLLGKWLSAAFKAVGS